MSSYSSATLIPRPFTVREKIRLRREACPEKGEGRESANKGKGAQTIVLHPKGKTNWDGSVYINTFVILVLSCSFIGFTLKTKEVAAFPGEPSQWRGFV